MQRLNIELLWTAYKIGVKLKTLNLPVVCSYDLPWRFLDKTTGPIQTINVLTYLLLYPNHVVIRLLH